MYDKLTQSDIDKMMEEIDVDPQDLHPLLHK